MFTQLKISMFTDHETSTKLPVTVWNMASHRSDVSNVHLYTLFEIYIPNNIPNNILCFTPFHVSIYETQ